MIAATGIEIATGTSAQSLLTASSPSKTQSRGLATKEASSPAAATSFRSNWQSLLASLGSILDGANGNETGAGAAQASTGVALSATTTTSQAGLSQTALTALPESAGKTQGTDTLTVGTDSSQAIAQTGASVLKSTPVIVRQAASQLAEKSTAKLHAAESTNDTHSAKNTKQETDSTGATEQVVAVPDSAPQFLAAPVPQVAIVTPSVAGPAPVVGTASLSASEDAPIMPIGLEDAAKGKTSLISGEIDVAGSQATNQVAESDLSGKAAPVSAMEAESEEPQVGVVTAKSSATDGPLSGTTPTDSAPASGTAHPLATSSSPLSVATSSITHSAASDQSPDPIVTSAGSANQTAAIDKGQATQAQIPVRAASAAQLQPLSSSNNQAQSAGTETLAVTAGGDGLQVSALAADTSKSQSSQTPDPSSVGKKAGVASAGRTSEQAASRSSQFTGTADAMQHSSVSMAVQSGVAVQDGAGLVRDPSVGHGSIGTSTTAASSRDESASRETFSALDAGSPTTPTWIHAGAQRAEAGFQDPSLGWVGVRADSSGGSVHASLVAGSADAAQTLSGHLAGLNAYLADQHSAVGQVTVATSEDRSAAYNMDQSMNQNMNQGAGQDGSRGQQPVPAVSVPAFTSAVSTVSAARTEVSIPGGNLGGTHISLIA